MLKDRSDAGQRASTNAPLQELKPVESHQGDTPVAPNRRQKAVWQGIILTIAGKLETDLVSTRTCEGIAIAKAKGKLRGRALSLPPLNAPCSTICQRRGTYHHRNRRPIRSLTGNDPSSTAETGRVVDLTQHAKSATIGHGYAS